MAYHSPFRPRRLPPALLLPAAECSAALTADTLAPDFVTASPTPNRPEPVPMAKHSVKKNSPPPGQSLDEKAKALTEAVAARFEAARPDPESAQDVPGVTQGGQPVHAVGFGFPNMNMSPAQLKQLLGGMTKNLLKLAVQFGGKTVEDFTAAQADVLDDFLPDEVYELVERIAHRLNTDADHPHTVRGAQAPAPSAPTGPPPAA